MTNAQTADSDDDRDSAFVAATLLARRGRYAEATALLEQALAAGTCSELDALDLQARIYAQQGRLLDAESCWRRAGALSGSPHAYDGPLRRLRQSGRPGFLGPIAIALVALLGTVAAWQMIALTHSVRSHEKLVDERLTVIRDEIAGMQRTALAREGDLALQLAKLGAAVRDVETQLSADLQSMSSRALENDRQILENDRQITVRVAAIEKHLAAIAATLAASVDGGQARDASNALESLRNRVAQLTRSIGQPKTTGPGR